MRAMTSQPSEEKIPAPADASDDDTRGSLSGVVATGLKWKVITMVVSEGTRFGVVLVLARLLTPRDYGVAAMAMVFAGLITLFTDVGLGAALVQRRTITEQDRSTVFWMSMAIAAVIVVFTVAVAGEVARFFGQPQVRSLVIVLSLSFPLAALSQTQTALLNRKLAYRSLEIRQIVGVLVGAATALIVAISGGGAWAIVANSLASTAAATALLWRFSSWRPSLTFSFESLRTMGGFGLKLTGTRLLNYANLNADNTLVGRFLGATSLGIYGISYNIMFTPLSRINLPIYGVVAPALARLQHDPERLKAAWLRSKRLTATLLNPAFFAILVVAPDLVRVVLPAKWLPAVPVIRLLCLAGLGHSLTALNATILQARGHAGTVLRISIFTSIVTLGAFASGLPWGILGVAGFFAAAKWLLVLPDTWITTRRAEVPLRSALWASGAMLPFGLASAAAGYGLQQLLLHAGAPAVVRLLAAGAAVFVVYAGLIYTFVPSFVREVRGVLSRRRARA